jgi:type IV pilus assembly protein PilM
MSLLSILTARNGSGRGPLGRRRGWIGIDVGTRSVKLVQVERARDSFRISTRWTLESKINLPEPASQNTDHEWAVCLPHPKSLRSLFTGRDCAAVLSMSLVDFRILEIPSPANEEEQRQMLGEELAADLGKEPSDLAFDGWELGNENGSPVNLKKMATIAIPKSTAEQVNNSLLAAGLECRALDGLPSALARAVKMSGLDDPNQAIIAVDLAYQCPMFVLVKGGRALFARTLRGVGLKSIMQPLETNLCISADQCQQLLSCYGVAHSGQAPVVATQKTMQLISNPLYNLVAEINRTIQYVGTQFRSLKPNKLRLFGGGALIKHLPEYLSERLRIQVAPWTLTQDQADPTDALYGVAAGLSALKWEAAECT